MEQQIFLNEKSRSQINNAEKNIDFFSSLFTAQGIAY